jgi:hypothetical protein
LGRSVLDQQADLWAAGATLYVMVAGSPPYQAENTRKLERLIRSRRPPRALPASCPGALKAVIRKSLAPDAERRYPSAGAFARDLSAFLEGKETVAEQEKRGSWKPNPTRESAAVGQASWPFSFRRFPLARIASALACILAGMLLFIGTSLCSRYWTGSRQVRATLDWDLYLDLQAQFAFLGKYSPVERLRAPLRSAYERDGAEAVDRSDWRRAEVSLARAVEVGAADRRTLARLAMARQQFTEAVRLAPDWAAPHVALARTYSGAPDHALAEIREAQRIGYVSTARDTDPIARGFLQRGFARLEAGDVPGARLDFDAARSLSGRIEVPDLRPLAPGRKVRGRRRR